MGKDVDLAGGDFGVGVFCDVGGVLGIGKAKVDELVLEVGTIVAVGILIGDAEGVTDGEGLGLEDGVDVGAGLILGLGDGGGTGGVGVAGLIVVNLKRFS